MANSRRNLKVKLLPSNSPVDININFDAVVELQPSITVNAPNISLENKSIELSQLTDMILKNYWNEFADLIDQKIITSDHLTQVISKSDDKSYSLLKYITVSKQWSIFEKLHEANLITPEMLADQTHGPKRKDASILMILARNAKWEIIKKLLSCQLITAEALAAQQIENGKLYASTIRIIAGWGLYNPDERDLLEIICDRNLITTDAILARAQIYSSANDFGSLLQAFPHSMANNSSLFQKILIKLDEVQLFAKKAGCYLDYIVNEVGPNPSSETSFKKLAVKNYFKNAIANVRTEKDLYEIIDFCSNKMLEIIGSGNPFKNIIDNFSFFSAPQQQTWKDIQIELLKECSEKLSHFTFTIPSTISSKKCSGMG